MNWNRRITDRRTALGYTKAAFSRLVGVSGATVTDWENGVIKTLAGENLIKVASVLQVSPQWLLTGRADRASGTHAGQEPAAYSLHAELLASWVLLLPHEQAELLADIKRRAAHNRAVLASLSGKDEAGQESPASATPPRGNARFYGMPQATGGKKHGEK